MVRQNVELYLLVLHTHWNVGVSSILRDGDVSLTKYQMGEENMETWQLRLTPHFPAFPASLHCEV